MANRVIAVDDPLAADVRELVSRHLDFARSLSPPENVFGFTVCGPLASYQPSPYSTFMSLPL